MAENETPPISPESSKGEGEMTQKWSRCMGCGTVHGIAAYPGVDKFICPVCAIAEIERLREVLTDVMHLHKDRARKQYPAGLQKRIKYALEADNE